MKIAAMYPFKSGMDDITSRYPGLLAEVLDVIGAVDATACRVKKSKEKTMQGKMLFSPVMLNQQFKAQFTQRGWHSIRVPCEYPSHFYVAHYQPRTPSKGAFREMDFVKEYLGIEVQFGKYAFMVYNVAAKMTIFRNLGHIDAGIEIVPVKALAEEMSTGVSYFEQFAWDLEHRGSADIDIPVLVIGIDV